MVGGRVRRAKKRQDVSLDSVTGTCDTRRACRSACTLYANKHIAKFLLDRTDTWRSLARQYRQTMRQTDRQTQTYSTALSPQHFRNVPTLGMIYYKLTAPPLPLTSSSANDQTAFTVASEERKSCLESAPSVFLKAEYMCYLLRKP